ncbi:hypothetical protein BGZ74_011168 [Mortierella antarctica]|nr:hypothetical protein BGZ74_011168 [Mortierella antarctica]
MLSRGFSIDSNPQNDTKTEHWFMQGKSRDGAPVTIGRKMKAKDRLVSLIKRGTNSTTASLLGIAVENGASQESLPHSSIHRNSIDERGSTRPGPSPDLSQTRSRRQGSPAMSRSGNMERSPAAVSADAMMGFPYNNSSLLMSTDLGRAVPSKSPLSTKTARSSKPRPFSVATMEKLMSPGQEPLYKDRSPRPHRDRLPLERQDSGVEHSPDHNHRRLFRSNDMEDSHHSRARITGSGSHPLLSTFESPFSTDDATKGKQTEKEEREPVLVSSPVQEDVDTMKGPLHVHEHHPQQPQQRRTLDVFGTSPQGQAQGHASTMASDEGSTVPLVTAKKKSILGTMTVKSSMRKRFFAEQKKQEVDLSNRRGSQQTEKTSPLSSLVLSDFEKENGSTDDGPVGRFVSRHRGHVGPYGPAGATIRVKRNQTRIPLDGLTDDELDEEGNTTIDSQDPERSGQQPEGNHRAKFLSRLKRFLLRPSPFANKGGVAAGSATTPSTPTEAATVRIPKTRWTRSGNNLPDLGLDHGHERHQESVKERHFSEGQLVYYPSQREESKRRWMSPDIYEEPSKAPHPMHHHKREGVDIRTQFQQSAPEQLRQNHQHHYHHHHHHSSHPHEQHP